MKKIIHATTNGDLDNLKLLYRLHKHHFGPFLYSYAIRNNQINIIDYLYNHLLYEINGVSHDSLLSSNGGRSHCKFTTIQHIVVNCGIKEPITMYQRCIDILVNNRKFKRSVEYAKGFRSDYSESINYLLNRIDREYPQHMKKPDDLFEIYRDITIEQILY